MKILTKRKQARILKRLIVMSKAVTELSQFYIPVTEYPKTAGAIIEAIADIADDVGGIPAMNYVGKHGFPAIGGAEDGNR